MSSMKSLLPRVAGRKGSRPIKPALESLEGRVVMAAYPAAATIVGEVSNAFTGQGVAGVQVQLIDSSGRIIVRGPTNSQGLYLFNVPQAGNYVVREVTPRGSVQLSPTFSSAAPVGSYVPGAGATSWNYTSTNTNPALGPVGPSGWYTIAPAGLDGNESPVNLTGPTVDLSRYMAINYTPVVPSQAINNSHQIQVQTSSTYLDVLYAGGQLYNLQQFHYHEPAENTINGKTNVMEEHFVNVSASGAEAVVAVFLQVGAHNNALDPILNAAVTNLVKINSKTKAIATPIDFSVLLPTDTQGWFYQGSLTTPPLSQPVSWFVFKTPITLDATQLAEYQYVAGAGGFLPNARPVQPTDGRIFNEIDNYVTVYTGPGANYIGANFTII